ncbi:MAG: DUF5685 family protein [Oscillospiraceae bacterium]|nr:DUF5685 family protein [Oscillospiraceae bacterium]
MFGYVRPAAHRLSEEENERFRAAYCGLCHTLGRKYGFAARFLLNYDFTLLAILLSLGTDTRIGCRRCVVHPCKGCSAMNASSALDTAAAYSVVLSWWQLQDHIADHGFFAALGYRFAALLLRRAYRKARADAADFDTAVRAQLQKLSEREAAHCASLDAAAEPFATLLSQLALAEPDVLKRRVYAQLFYHLGRWIYLVDAADDFTDDAKSGNYNPIRYRYSLSGDALTDEVRCALGETLDASIRQMASAYALLDAGAWTGVLDSIFYDSLYGIGGAVLRGVYRKPSRLRHEQTTEGDTQ